MVFEIYKPEKTRMRSIESKKSIRVAFRCGQKTKKTTPWNIHIYVGIEIAQKMGLKEGEKISFYVDRDNPRLWLMKKPTTQTSGYTLSGVPNALRTAFKWEKFIPQESEREFKSCKFDIHDGGIRIYGN